MKVRLAKTAGYCFGVRRAMELALQAAHSGRRGIFTYGPLIHNPQALELLRTKGVEVLGEVPPPGSQNGGTVIIRAHGVPAQEKTALKEAGFDKVVDGTCPRVVRVQAVIKRSAAAGKDVVIVGDPEHPEVKGLLSFAEGRGQVVSGPEEVASLPALERVVAVAQTTQNQKVFNQVVDALEKRFGPIESHNTICEATHRRQQEVARLAAEVDGVVVVGGKASANTRRLAQIAGQKGREVFLVETEAELERERLAQLNSVGVTAGASTPSWMIKKVMRELAAIRSSKEAGLVHFLRRFMRFLVLSQILVALGAAGMSVACCALQGLAPSLALAGAAALYIFTMHILNQFLDKEAGQYNEPDRAHFLSAHRAVLIGSGMLAGAGSLALCAYLGPWPLALVAVMSVLGLLYSVPFFPGRLERRLGVHRVKDIPGSKTLSAAGGWAVITALLPAVSQGHFANWALPLAFAYAFILVFVRCALFDILDVQGDLIVGKETIPITLGEKRTHQLLRRLIAGLALLLVIAALMGAPAVAWALLAPLAGLAAMQLVLAKGMMMPGATSEGMVDLNFWLAGGLALAWL